MNLCDVDAQSSVTCLTSYYVSLNTNLDCNFESVFEAAFRRLVLESCFSLLAVLRPQAKILYSIGPVSLCLALHRKKFESGSGLLVRSHLARTSFGFAR